MSQTRVQHGDPHLFLREMADLGAEEIVDPLGRVQGDVADLLAGLGPPAAAAPSPSPGRPSEAVPFPDPMGRNTRPGSAAELDPFAGLDDFAAPARPASPAPAGLLDDFSDLGLPAVAAPGATGQRIDDLFGGSAGLGGDPLQPTE